MHLNLSKSKHELQHGIKILNEGHSKTTQAKNFKYLGIYCKYLFFFFLNLSSVVPYFWYRQVLTLKFVRNQTATEHKLIWAQNKMISLKETDFEKYFHIYVSTWGGHCSIHNPGSDNMSIWMLIRWATGPKNNIHTYSIAMHPSFALDCTLPRCT